jgi:homoserine dehydrogenase
MKDVRIGIVGYGTVGRGTAEAIAANSDEIAARTGARLRVTAVSRRTPMAAPDGARAFTDWKELVASSDVDIVVETIGGTTVALDIVRRALELGKPVVTANKNLMANHGEAIFSLALAKNLPVGIEASVAGGVPIIRVLAEAISGDRLKALRGILNGTSNYILTRMEHDGLGFDQALKLAQEAGYAEADPTMDVDGIDARDKLCILARLAFRYQAAPAEIPTVGIRRVSAVDIRYAHSLNARIRLLASAQIHQDDLSLSVRPWVVSRQLILSSVEGANNAVLIEGERAGTQMLYGPGAGGGPTGVAVLSDLMQIAADFAHGRLAFREAVAVNNRPLHLGPMRRPVPWYLRLTVKDEPGIIARVADAIAHHKGNIDSVLQDPGMKKTPLSFVITLEPSLEPAIADAVRAIDAMPFMAEPAHCMPMLS